MNPHEEDPGHVTHCSRPDLAGQLLVWDELDFQRRVELERHAGDCASCGPALSLLRRADAWLASSGREVRSEVLSASPCPSSEDLYDFGVGPGARELGTETRRTLEAHLVTCADCRGLVATLASRPPSPLDLSPDDATERFAPELGPRPFATRVAPARVRRSPSRWVMALAAAIALAVAAGLLWKVIQASGPAQQSAFPGYPILRGDQGGPLDFPRDRVLAVERGAPWSALVFEIRPQAGASGYRVVVRAHEGGAFARGNEIAKLRSSEPALPADVELTAALTSGYYTWEAWATVNDLDVFLGKRDFELARDEALTGELQQALALSGDERTRSVLELLHGRGYLGDARAFARTLPPSPDRDAYLEQVPGR